VTPSGLVAGETLADFSGTLAYGGSSQGAINAGLYVITPLGLSNPNYRISYLNGVLTINPPNPGDVTNPNTDTTPIDTTLTGLGDLLAGLEPTAAGDEDQEKIKAKYRKDGSPVGVRAGGVKLPPMMR
jgi:hypothetical protein